MCNCFEKMLEKGYAEEGCIYDEQSKDYRKTGEYLIKLASGVHLRIKHCPICGKKITP